MDTTSPQGPGRVNAPCGDTVSVDVCIALVACGEKIECATRARNGSEDFVVCVSWRTETRKKMTCVCCAWSARARPRRELNDRRETVASRRCLERASRLFSEDEQSTGAGRIREEVVTRMGGRSGGAHAWRSGTVRVASGATVTKDSAIREIKHRRHLHCLRPQGLLQV